MPGAMPTLAWAWKVPRTWQHAHASVGMAPGLDTMANIDLDYGAAVAAIAVESVARAATGEIKA